MHVNAAQVLLVVRFGSLRRLCLRRWSWQSRSPAATPHPFKPPWDWIMVDWYIEFSSGRMIWHIRAKKRTSCQSAVNWKRAVTLILSAAQRSLTRAASQVTGANWRPSLLQVLEFGKPNPFTTRSNSPPASASLICQTSSKIRPRIPLPPQTPQDSDSPAQTPTPSQASSWFVHSHSVPSRPLQRLPFPLAFPLDKEWTWDSKK